MQQFIFLHLDINGCLWKHVHFSYISAVKARKAWAAMGTIVKAVSKSIRSQPRNVESPRIIGRTLNTVILL